MKEDNRMEKVNATFSFSKDSLFENLTEEEKKIFISECSLLYNNKALKKICDDIYTQGIVSAVSDSQNFEHLAEKRGFLYGITTIFETIQNFHLEYMDSIKKEESFDKHEII